MPSAKNAIVKIETGQTFFPFHTLTDSGDNTKFSSSHAPWSKMAGFEYSVLPNGLATGCAVTPSTGNDKVDVAAGTVYLAGVLTTVAADTDLSLTRGADTHTQIINSVTIDSTGALAIIAGVDHTAFSAVRGDAGGPPFIPVGSVEIAQVQLSSVAAAVVAVQEILAVVGQHCERYDYPTFTENPILGTIEFSSALPLSHTGGLPKRVYAKVSTPLYQDVALANTFVPAENANSATSTQVYGGAVGGSTTSLGQASFTAILSNGHTDPVLAARDKTVLVKFMADKNRAAYSLTQGLFAIKRTYPAAAEMLATCTISAEVPTQDFAG